MGRGAHEIDVVTVARAELRSDRMVEGVRLVEHTADVGIEAEGESMAECLARVAAGLFGLMFLPAADADPDRELEVDLEAGSDEELLVAWLHELLYRTEVEDICFIHFEVEGVGHRLKGGARGIPLAETEPAGPGIKAVTRHDLQLARVDGRWRARVLVDV